MKKIFKFFCFCVLPMLTLIIFTIIGKASEKYIYAREGTHPTMSGGISLMAWSYRGMFAAILIVAFSFVLYSKTSKIGKFLVFIMILVINLPIMYYMDLLCFFPIAMIIIPIANIFAFIPALIRKY